MCLRVTDTIMSPDKIPVISTSTPCNARKTNILALARTPRQPCLSAISQKWSIYTVTQCKSYSTTLSPNIDAAWQLLLFFLIFPIDFLRKIVPSRNVYLDIILLASSQRLYFLETRSNVVDSLLLAGSSCCSVSRSLL